MSLNLATHHTFPPSTTVTVTVTHHLHPSTLSKPPFLHHHSKTPFSLSLCSASPSSNSPLSSTTTTPIFLPYLQQQEEAEEEEEEEEEAEETEQPHDPDDPIYKFFKGRTLASSQDPQSEGKLTLQKNRRISWHLATEIEEEEEEEEESEAVGLDEIPLLVEEEVEEEETKFHEKELPEGIVGEIVQIARNLPENVTLEEALNDGFEGRVSERDCWEVLEVLGGEEEGKLVVCCLYFFQWMRSQEPSLVTARACTVLFPALGRAKLGDKLMVLFRNLPSGKEFRDVHVYNAAISGLLASGRY